jgi:tRNA_anti-like
MPRRLLALLVAAVIGTAVGCMDRLPDEDLRILIASPSARLSATILWDEYSADTNAADRAYWGKAIIVTGIVTEVRGMIDPATGVRHELVLFGQADAHGIQARLLDEQSGAIMSGLETGQRLSLKCYCEGRPADLGGDVLLKSCVTP